MTEANTSAPAANRGFGPVVEFASRVLAPAGVLTAVLFYFGYVREQALFAYFGVGLGSLGFTTTDYLVRSTGTVFVPVATLLVAAVAAVAGHYLLSYWLGRRVRRSQRITCLVLCAAAVVLLLFGVIGLYRRADPLLSPLAAPAALGTGAFLLEYAVGAARTTGAVPDPLSRALASTVVLRWVTVAALVLVAVFWATANVAQQRGIDAARAIELSLLTQPQAVVYSRSRLQITGPGVTLTPLDATGEGFAFRYSGLRTLAHTGGRWFLLPAGWTHENGATVILLSENSDAIRVDLAP